MSALGQKRTCAVQKVMSALPPIADMCSAQADVRFVPIADIQRRSYRPLVDEFVNDGQYGWRDGEAKLFCRA